MTPSLLRPKRDPLSMRAGMKNAIFASFYVLGLSAFFPLLVANHRSAAAWPMFLAPIVAAAFAEVLGRTVHIARDISDNRAIWLIAAFVLLAQIAKYTLKLDASDGFTEYLALNALYQVMLVIVFASFDKRGTKNGGVSHGQAV